MKKSDLLVNILILWGSIFGVSFVRPFVNSLKNDTSFSPFDFFKDIIIGTVLFIVIYIIIEKIKRHTK